MKKQLKGSSTFDAWAAECWAVFNAACIMLGVASPATLDRYAEGIRRLSSTRRRWTVIIAADERLRREQWDIMADKVRAEPPTRYDPATPWNASMQESAYSLSNSLAEWWYFEVVAPLPWHSRNPQAAVASLEGLRALMWAGASPSHDPPKRTVAASSASRGAVKRIKGDVSDVFHDI